MDSNSDSATYQQQLQVSYYFPELHFPYLSEEDINICTEYISGLSEDQDEVMSVKTLLYPVKYYI